MALPLEKQDELDALIDQYNFVLERIKQITGGSFTRRSSDGTVVVYTPVEKMKPPYTVKADGDDIRVSTKEGRIEHYDRLTRDEWTDFCAVNKMCPICGTDLVKDEIEHGEYNCPNHCIDTVKPHEIYAQLHSEVMKYFA